MRSGVVGRLMKGRCPYCGRTMRLAWIPNRGPVMAHAHGDRQRCNWLREIKQDLVSRSAKKSEHRT